jgi:uncharacterized protein UPF0158
MKVNIQKLDMAVDFVSSVGFAYDNHYAAISKKTGEIFYVTNDSSVDGKLPDDIEDSDKYIDVPTKFDLDLGKRIVFDFAYEFLDEEKAELVVSFFNRRGGYSRLKDFLTKINMLDKWYKYEEKRTMEALKEWGEAYGIEFD